MRTTLLILAALMGVAAPALAANGMTALQALKLLPKDAWPRLARVAGFEGNPAPERWHLLVHDTREEGGVHEYVVARGEVVASRGVSQFAEELKAEDVIGGDAVKIDSDRAAAIAQQYAQANNLTMATCNFELKKDGDGAVPVWRVSCVDAKGGEVGQIFITATKGTVVRHEGFTVEPPAVDPKQQAAQLAAAQKQAFYNQRATQLQARRAAAARERAAQQQQQQQEPSDRPGFFHRLFGGGQ